MSASKSSLARFYRHLVKNRAMDEMSEIMEAAEEVNGLQAKLESMRASAWKLIGKQFLAKAMTGGDVKELAALGG